jgi:peptidoglycan hydrolase-like protein with peptidoglycan-binding domain
VYTGPAYAPEQNQWGAWPIVPKGELRRGAKGDTVRYLQAVLRLKAGVKVAMDGSYGPQTEAAVTAFQTANQLPADGACGPNTWAKIDAFARTP